MSGLNTQVCGSCLQVYEPADRCRVLIIVDVSHEASIIGILHKQLLAFGLGVEPDRARQGC